MKLIQKKYSGTIPLIAATLSIAYFFSSLPTIEASRAYHYKHPCSDLSLCRGGQKTGWVGNSRSLPPFDYGSNLLDNVVTEIFRAPIPLNSLFEQSQRHLAESMSRSSLRYDITETEEKMELSLDLPGVRPEDVSVELRQDGKAINISGSRNYKRHGEMITSKFDQTFTINDAMIDVGTIDANLTDGVLVISALKKPKTLPAERKIPIHTKNQDSTLGVQNTTEKTETDVARDTTNEPEKKDTNQDDIEISQEEDI